MVVSANALPTGEIYKKWQKRTNKTLALAGASEDGGEGGDYEDDDGDDDGGGRNGRGGKKRGRNGARQEDERFMGFKRFRHTQDKRGDSTAGGRGGQRKAREELKNATQIHKERQKKEKEKERLAAKKKGGGKGYVGKESKFARGGGGFRGKWR